MSGATLLKDLKKQVTALEDDLRERSESVEEFRTRLEAEYTRAREGKRTAATYGAWRDERVTQAAAAWVLGCVFVRFCEDNRLIEWPFLAGPGDRLRDAEERHEAFFREKPHLNNRDWLEEAFQHLAESNETAAGLFDRTHNPLWGLTPSYEAATELLSFWRRRGADGEILYDFTDPEWDTRFLGDLYQDLSEHARKTYALLQTPEFVEEFILDLTLEPAIEEFGLAPDGGLRTIDPACGSGHFLLGIFGRLVEKWRAAEPGTDEWALVRRALESVHGCDKNPFAASIARFRLLVAAMKEAGARRLAEAPVFPINVAVGDSLLHGRGAAGIQMDLDTLFAEEEGDGSAFQYVTEDVGDFASRVDLLGRGSYHVVVGNPPYIRVQDERENENYRAGFDTCHKQYQLSVPFVQRIFELAVRGRNAGDAGGFTGQITSNGFMKRDFGQILIERFLPTVQLSHVIDTSGASIPGHNRDGTPTVILIGRRDLPHSRPNIRLVKRLRGESSPAPVLSEGPVWSAIKDQLNRPGGDSEWILISDVPRSGMSTFPWRLGSDASDDVLDSLARSGVSIRDVIAETGRTTHTGLDDAFFVTRSAARAHRIDRDAVPVVLGRGVRDFRISSDLVSFFPYDQNGDARDLTDSEERFAWPNRTTLRERVDFNQTPEERGLRWFDHSMFFPRRFRSKAAIAYAFKVSHNHFALEDGGRVFNRHAPVIILPEGGAEEEYLDLLTLLNSSSVCLWMISRSQHQGGGAAEDSWSWTYEFSGGIIKDIPVPPQIPTGYGALLDEMARKWPDFEVLGGVDVSDLRASLDSKKRKMAAIKSQMVGVQEEIDWAIYGAFRLIDSSVVSRLTAPWEKIDSLPEVNPGERAFEIAMARRGVSLGKQSGWFTKNDIRPVVEIPSHWPNWYRDIIQSRILLIESRKDIALIERPEYKRRWADDSWEKTERVALRNGLLDRIEEPSIWYALRDGIRQPRTLTVSQLADALRDDTDFNSVAQLYAADHMGKPDLPLADVLAEVVDAEHVPYLAALRYKDSGLRNREQWEQVWELQREEDRTGQRLDIPVPSKYKGADFLKQSYWSNRGKLDVPKERFISYLKASPDADSTVLLGWAGWDHKDQAQALFNLVDDRTKQAGWDTDRIKPLLAGLLEVMPWVRQWHGEYDEEWEGVPADEYQAYFEELCAKHQVSEADLRAWRPEKTRAKKKTASKETVSAEQPALGE
ncbi:BREX-2 system adenine-specific DNA-methyltransferase PglX [Streptomyces sp. NPDC051016]|uniref:BREX-2 system adenine-specific DNA-methyltransferase PglX n=1 Tax=Streptomyces sp. NPDC051016 TaxID=3365638 RepID=UPI0037B11193